MQYGQADNLNKADLSLPPDHPQTKKILAAQKKAAKTKVYVGCAKWGRPDWVGKIYPKGTKATDFLEAYAKQFDCVELNSIFYQLPTLPQVKKWKSVVGMNFKFCPKFTESITHRKRLKNADYELNTFLEVIYELDKHVGPIFLMPHPQMGPKHMDTIFSFLESLPKEVDVFVEFRHLDFFKEPAFNEMFSWLEKKKIGSVIDDTAGVREGVHMRLTTPNAFIRFTGNSLHKTDYTRIDDWILKIKKWMNSGLKTCWFFMHQHEELHSPELCKYLIEQLNKECRLSIKVPQFYKDKNSLF
jgi:uncharacterized protein YecE (DUF72 family)